MQRRRRTSAAAPPGARRCARRAWCRAGRSPRSGRSRRRPPPKRGKPMFTRQPVAGTPDRSATPSACAKPWCISQASPSSVGVESVSSGSWPWNRMCRLRCRNFSASSDTPGNSVSVRERRVGPALRPVGAHEDHAARRDAAVPALQAPDVGDLEVVVEVLLHLPHDRDHHELAHRERRRQLVDRGLLGRPVRGRVELGAELVGREPVGGGLEAVLRVGVRPRPWPGSTAGEKNDGPKPFQTGICGVSTWDRSMYFAGAAARRRRPRGRRGRAPRRAAAASAADQDQSAQAVAQTTLTRRDFYPASARAEVGRVGGRGPAAAGAPARRRPRRSRSRGTTG